MIETPPATRYDAIVLAGTRASGDPVAITKGVKHKAIVPVAGTPMLVRVVTALASCEVIDRIAISIEIPDVVEAIPQLEILAEQGRLITAETADTPSKSVAKAVGALGQRFPILVTTADHALLSPDIVETFIEGLSDRDADVVAGVASKDVIQKAYPDTKRTYLKFRDGQFSGCNLFALMTPRAMQAVTFWRRVEEQRKRPWHIARAVGISSLFLYLTGLLTLRDGLARLSRCIGARADIVRLAIAEAAIDVDKPDDLDHVERILGTQEP